ncbi:hybrid sensor histidine kinase/response regulator [Pedobacter cryophilus]|uniref:histidine kinase n=1 Tax=Pedobacter cryophilus TaxID=2571271 RepID=A0A4U1C7E2_9SPHI|nr:hybrid sensor histidine kinase/response regulator [Pedobacter cryophilus]TKC00317.1 response regulator [Pedobacter cryophilus]
MKPIKVLLVDDDEDDYILTRDIFNDIPQKEKYKLSWINNYEEGINAMLKSHYDVYLVDYRLGKYTGLDLLHEAIKSNVDEPIIILTGKGDAKVDEEALETGAADYLVKDQINPYTIERSLRYALKSKHTIKALRESENKFRIIFERSKEPFIIMDSLGGVRDINKAGLKFFQYSIDEIRNLNATSLYANKQDSLSFSELMDEKGAVNDFETDLITKDKEIKKVTISAFLQIDQHATEELYYCIIHDITDRKKEEKASVDAEKIAVTERIAKSLANEIRNPLSNINLSIEQLKLDVQSEDESVNLYIDIIQTNFERINLLITDFINSTQSLELNIQPRALNILIDESIDRIKLEIDKSRVVLNKEFNQTDLLVDVDNERIVSTFYNILSNAIGAFSKEIIINVYEQNDFAIIEIIDDGEGISVENQARIYEPFFTTKQKSLGLGLTNAQKSIINHKGNLHFESTENQGTKFVIKLPLTNQTQLWEGFDV